jgi:quercetin dioxygenase-like cupin family protein
MPRRAALTRWDELALEKITEMASRKAITGGRETMAQVWFKKGALVARHLHESEQMTYVLDGALRCTIDGEDLIVRAGEVMVIPSGVPHQIEILEDTLVIDTFSPARTDWNSTS